MSDVDNRARLCGDLDERIGRGIAYIRYDDSPMYFESDPHIRWLCCLRRLGIRYKFGKEGAEKVFMSKTQFLHLLTRCFLARVAALQENERMLRICFIQSIPTKRRWRGNRLNLQATRVTLEKLQ